ncbi:phospholipase D-like domain-containing protein [Idiomarina xiamenensis]|nr:phospholipase D-like domain-containing protein [Idiomarina xiamenensis]
MMPAWLSQSWPYIVLCASVTISLAAAIHVTMHKRDVRAAIGWVGLVLLSPFVGSTIYLIAGINRIRVKRVSRRRDHIEASHDQRLLPDEASLTDNVGLALTRQKLLADRISKFPLVEGNRVEVFSDGDNAYQAMLAAIDKAKHYIVLQSYIFDYDYIGRRFVDALSGAQQRGVNIRVLVDAIGEKYSPRPVSRFLRRSGIAYARFMPPKLGLRLAYANMRSHRKLLIVDGQAGFTGGMNIRQAFSREACQQLSANGKTVTAAKDTHFCLQGPVVQQLMYSFAHDWEFSCGESLHHRHWFKPAATPGYVPARCITSGPDQALSSNHGMLLGALAAAQQRVMLQSPYFLPDSALLGALMTTARRGVTVDIVLPAENNLRLVDYAMNAQLDLVIDAGCRVWRAPGFDHSKLLTVDGAWSYIGSSNLDPRSLRLNFELDVELYDRNLAVRLEQQMQAHIDAAEAQTTQQLAQQPFIKRLRNKLIWLASPYL